MYTKRGRVWIGTICNIRCGFCYYYYTGLKTKRTLENMKKQIDIMKKMEMEALDFTGGEPTIIPEIFELASYAREKEFKIICTLTNGLRMADKDFTKRLIESGLNEVLFSVHGCCKEEHDRLTQVNGSFEKLSKAIENIKQAEIPFRINCTVSAINYRNLVNHANLYLKWKPFQVNFILFNDWRTAAFSAEQYCIKYSDAARYVKSAIDILKERIKYVNVRYIPLCFMKGYERHVCDYPQKIYDPFEWSNRVLIRLNTRNWLHPSIYYAYLLYGLVRTYPPFPGSFRDYADDICTALRRKSAYIKPPQCKICRYEKLCDGLEKSYVKFIGTKELVPEEGTKILEPLYFRKDFYKGYDYTIDKSILL